MKKREILNLIELNKIVLKNKRYKSIVLPEFDDIKDQIDILKTEIEEGKKCEEEALSKIKKFNCDHSVRLDYAAGGMFGGRSYSECVFCGATIDNDCIVNSRTIYEDTNRNRYCVMFRGNYFDDDEIYVDDGYYKSDIYDILLKILESKNDDEEVDFIKEIKELDIPKCRVDDRKKEKIHYILIVGGSNKYSINDRQYITSDRIPLITNFISLISETIGVRLEVFDNEETFKSKSFTDRIDIYKSKNTRFFHYETIKRLLEKIDNEKHVPFDIIIDISSLYNYGVVNGEITSSKVDIDFSKIFPNSYIIKIDDFGSRSEKELLEILREKLVIYNEAYGYIRSKKIQFGNMNDDDFYVLNDNKIGYADVSDVYKNIRKVLIKR